MRLPRAALAAACVLTGFIVLPASASCGVSGVRGTDPGRRAIGAEIDRAAARRKVPPYLLKAIAWQESKWRQYDAYGRVVLSPRCAIGVLQVLANGFDAGRLARDWKYNVDAGAQVLAAKMAASSANVPKSLGADDRRVGENWYRATYRYNGSGYAAMRYADAVFATVVQPPPDIATYTSPVGIVNPRSVVSGYTPQSGHGYVAHLDGTWASTLGSFRHGVVRGDFIASRPRITVGRTLEGDQQAGAMFVARNLGWETWTSSRVSLSTYPVGRASRLRHPRWVSSTRPVALAVSTPPGGDAKFGFSVQAARVPSSMSFAESFVPVVDGSVSMGARTSSSWTLHPARTPSARIASAPAYVTERSTDSTAVVGLAFGDPSPGSGVAYVEVAKKAPGSTSWTTSRVTSTSVRVSLPGAGAHAVRVRAVDRAGHASAWTDPTSIVVPRDDTDATRSFSGTWTAVAESGAWLGSLASASSGAEVTVPVHGSSYALIGPRGPGLATLSVYLDGVLVTVVDPSADEPMQRQVLWESALPPGDHVLRVVAGSGTAALDAIAVV